MRNISLILLLVTGTLLLSCASNKSKKSDTPEIVEEVPIDVGSIHVRLRINELDIHSGVIRAELMEVLGYGANTEPLNTGREMTFSTTSQVNLGDLEQGQMLDAQIRSSAPGMGMGGTAPTWTIVKLLSSK